MTNRFICNSSLKVNSTLFDAEIQRNDSQTYLFYKVHIKVRKAILFYAKCGNLEAAHTIILEKQQL